MKQALAHPFFDSLRDPSLERECPSPMNWQQLKELSSMGFQEMLAFLHKELAYWDELRTSPVS